MSSSASDAQTQSKISVHEIFWDGTQLREALFLKEDNGSISRSEWNNANTDNPKVGSTLQESRRIARTVALALQFAVATRDNCDQVAQTETGIKAEKAATTSAILTEGLDAGDHILHELDMIHPDRRSTGLYPDGKSVRSVRRFYSDVCERASQHLIHPDEIAKTAEILRLAQDSLPMSTPRDRTVYETMSALPAFTKKDSKRMVVKAYFKDLDDLNKAMSTAYERLEVAYERATGKGLGAVLDDWKKARSEGAGQRVTVNSDMQEQPSDTGDGASDITVRPSTLRTRASAVSLRLKNLLGRE